MNKSSQIIRKFERFMMMAQNFMPSNDKGTLIGNFQYDFENGTETYTNYIDNTVTVTHANGTKTVTPNNKVQGITP